MDLLLQIGAVAGGFGLAVLASRVAVDGASDLVQRTRIHPFIIGITLVAIGTDLPEIVNSIVASVQGYGDVNVGDSTGSALTQATLVLGLLPILAGAVVVTRRRISAAGAVTVAALVLGAWLVGDGDLSRVDGAILASAWVAGSFVVWRQGTLQPRDRAEPGERPHRSLFELIGGLTVITGGVMLAVWGVVALAETLGVPAYLISFFGASLGTSIPELLFNVTALRKGQPDIAIGGIFGASLVDATLSIGIGPLVSPTAVTADLAVRGNLVAAGVIGLATLIVVGRRRHTWVSGVVLLVVYGLAYPILLF
ncbi:MAG: sodium:calcium antiporter [Acidimicrobiia bacterium]|nr:sodium:calcium antiporter [Acidimicrobiia bacterium]